MKNYKISDSGFGNSIKRNVIAIPIKDKCFNKDTNYHYHVDPISIWIIENC